MNESNELFAEISCELRGGPRFSTKIVPNAVQCSADDDSGRSRNWARRKERNVSRRTDNSFWTEKIFARMASSNVDQTDLDSLSLWNFFLSSIKSSWLTDGQSSTRISSNSSDWRKPVRWGSSSTNSCLSWFQFDLMALRAAPRTRTESP